MENNLITIDTFNADIQSSLPIIAFDKNIWIKRVEEMPVEDLTPGFVKQIKDAAIAIDKRLSAPIKAWRSEVDEIIACIDARRVALVKAQQEAEEIRRIKKRTEVLQLIKDVEIDCGLNQSYLSQLTIIDKYLNKTESINKIKEDLLSRIEQLKILQENERLAEESRQEKIKNRELLIENLNAKYNLDFKYSKFEVSRYDDVEVTKFYQQYQKPVEVSTVQEALKVVEVTAESQPVYVELVINSRTVKITGATLESVDNLLKAIEAKGYTVEFL